MLLSNLWSKTLNGDERRTFGASSRGEGTRDGQAGPGEEESRQGDRRGFFEADEEDEDEEDGSDDDDDYEGSD